MQGSVILNRVRATLLDPADVAWPAAEKLDYLNAAITATCQIKADAYPIRASIALAAGPYQTLVTTDPNAIMMMDAYANGNGASVNLVGRQLLNNADRLWLGRPQSAIVDEWVNDERDPRQFLVNPPNDGTGSLMVLYGGLPTRLTAETDSIGLLDSYESALWAHVLGQSYAKNSKRQDLPKSSSYMAMFMALVTGRTATVKQTMEPLDLADGGK